VASNFRKPLAKKANVMLVLCIYHSICCFCGGSYKLTNFVVLTKTSKGQLFNNLTLYCFFISVNHF